MYSRLDACLIDKWLVLDLNNLCNIYYYYTARL